MKEDLLEEKPTRVKIFELVIKSSLWEGIFVDGKSRNCKNF